MPVLIALVFTFLLAFNSCAKWDHPRKDESPAGFKADVIEKWTAMQLRLMKNATGIPNHAFSRHYAYAGIAAWESIAPGVRGHEWVTQKWNGLNSLAGKAHHRKYYWPANANAALASINRAMFPNASAADKSAVDSLENAFNEEFRQKTDEQTMTNSIQFGRQTAEAVFAWAQTDGAKDASSPYTRPEGEGLWKPTPPAFAPAATPYWGKNRPVVAGSIAGAQCPAPMAYSAAAGSPFYKMVLKVCDSSKVLTDGQKQMAQFWRDVPGVSSPGHWVSILHQALGIAKPSLAKGALAYALSGAAVNDALIACFKDKYKYNLVRPVTYIQEITGDMIWAPYLGTPAHPEYPSAHSSLSAGAATVLQELFGELHVFTDHTYDYMGFSPRSYPSFAAIAQEAGLSRFYAGIHYLPSVEAGLQQGIKVGENILEKHPGAGF
ncbi:vanadium-dependent haloperoxidase [Chitinophaga sp. YIM B06452]|uniref:vanadium-dependent haloperoxidase n=1 Tax=Chitinophaga sp. YIM B06452 TaxID=3082158 RepID=UPI0031FEC847